MALDRSRPRLVTRLLDTARRPEVNLIAAAVAWALFVAWSDRSAVYGTGRDALCYWVPSLGDPYRFSSWTSPIAYVYSPAFLQLVSPLTALPWTAFYAVWAALLIGCVRFLTGPRLFLPGLLFAAMEIGGGNITLFLAVAIVIGFRYPAAWALVLLTKITPGIGLLWFAVRGEWRAVGIAIAATAAVVGASALVMPDAWLDWIGVLTRIAGRDGTWAAVPVPLWVRFPIALVLVVWGARTDRPWTVPVASMLALPALWYGGFSMLLAVLTLRRADAGRPPSWLSGLRFPGRRRASVDGAIGAR